MNKINQIIETIPLKKLRALRDQISQRYRNDRQKGITSVEEAIAYLAFRSPATTAVQRRVFKELPDFEPQSIVDLGAGLGLSHDLIKESFPSISYYTAVEENPYMIEIGKKLNSKTDWVPQSYVTTETPKSDIVLGSYTFSELSENNLKTAIEKAWTATNDCLVLIETGTPEGFKTLTKCRDYLINKGGYIHAPCGHNGACPMVDKSDWCHFSIRLERTKLHRDMKEGSLPFEDEKYCYLIATKQDYKPPYKRILKTPLARKGHIKFDLCTNAGIEPQTFTKSKDSNFKEVKKLDWGDRLYV